MIGTYFIKNRFKFIKVERDTALPVYAKKAVDGVYVLNEKIQFSPDGPMLPLVDRARPFLAEPYESYFCDDWKKGNMHEKCKICKPFDHYWDGYEASILTGQINKLVVVDVDTKNSRFNSTEKFLNYVTRSFGPLPETLTALTPSGGLHLYYYYPYPFKKDGAFIQGLEFFGDGGKLKFPPYAKNDIPYKWKKPPTKGCIKHLPAWIRQIETKKHEPSRFDYKPVDRTINRKEIAEMLNRLNPAEFRGSDGAHEKWVQLGYSLCGAGLSDLFIDWCKRDARRTDSLNSQVARFKHGKSTIGSFYYIAKEYGVVPERSGHI